MPQRSTETSFKAGRSGNPRGRPKGSKNVMPAVRDIMNGARGQARADPQGTRRGGHARRLGVRLQEIRVPPGRVLKRVLGTAVFRAGGIPKCPSHDSMPRLELTRPRPDGRGSGPKSLESGGWPVASPGTLSAPQHRGRSCQRSAIKEG